MAKIISSLSGKIIAVLGVSAISYKAYMNVSAESNGSKGYMIVTSQEPEETGFQKKRDTNKDSEFNKRKLKKAIQESKTLVQQFMIQKSIPGLVIGVSYKGQKLWVKGFGFSNIETGSKCKPETVMRIASISKPITMLLLAKLLEEGKLDLDKPINDYLKPEQFPRKKWKGKDVDITLRQLVSHLGGIRHYNKSSPDESSEFDLKEYYIRTKYKDVFESLNIFKDDDLIAEPGTKFHYTTFGWTLISAVIESALPAGESFGTYLVNKVLKKELGMYNTYIDVNESIIRDRSSYYFHTKKGVLTNSPFVENSYKIAGGGLLSTIPDLLTFGNIMMYSYLGGNSESKRKGFLNRETVEELWKPASNPGRGAENRRLTRFLNYGMGWFVVKDDNEESCASGVSPPFPTIAYHSGTAVGASSILFVVPDQEICVAAFCNLQEVSLADLGLDVAQKFASSLSKNE